MTRSVELDLLDLLDGVEETVQKPDYTPRRHLLRLPWEERNLASRFGGRWDTDLKCTVVESIDLPDYLLDSASPPHSWERWLEDEANADRKNVAPPALGGDPVAPITLRLYQSDAVKLAVAAKRAGRNGFLLADDVGLGKTYTAIAAALALGAKKILVLAPLSALPAWRLSISALDPDGKARWVVLNYDRSKALLTVPKSAESAKKARTKNKRTVTAGKSRVAWDVVIADEAHLLANPVAQRTAAVRRLSGEGTARRAFTLWLSATAGSTPLGISYLAPILTTGAEAVSDLDDFAAFLRSTGIEVSRGGYGKWEWASNDGDLEKVRSLLYDGKAPRGIRRRPVDLAGWPELDRELLPIDLDPAGKALYRAAWTEFRSALSLVPRGKDPTNSMVLLTRFRQKAELLRIPGIVEAARTALGNGLQVAVSLEFLESIDAFVTAFGTERVAVISGKITGPAREAERVAFQRGEAKVVAFNVTAAINLHAGDAMVGGNDVPRTTISSPRYSAIAMLQIEGRTHRDGKYSRNSITYAADTVERKIVEVLLGRMRDTQNLNGDDTKSVATALDDLLRELPV